MDPNTDNLLEGIPLTDLMKRWGVCRNTVKHWARRLNVPIDRPSTTEAYWPFDRVAEGDRLHAWVVEGNALYRYPHFPEEAV